MRVGTHSAVSLGRKLFQFRNQPAVLVEYLFRLLVAHPFLQNAQLLGVFLHLGQRHLVRTPEAFEPVTAHLLWRAPAFRRAQHNHRPARSLGHAGRAAFLLMFLDLEDALFDGRRHRLVHAERIGALDEIGCPSVAA